MAKVTGIGGVFIKSHNKSAELVSWYKKNLGMEIESFGGSILNWSDDKADDKGMTVWSVAEKDSQWFSPSDSTFMINYRVDNLVELIEQLNKNGVELVGELESHENGKFAWIMDPEGNKVELWQPMAWDEKNKES
ncbi:MAG: VOC family protein [Marinicellaceae bacterium]